MSDIHDPRRVPVQSGPTTNCANPTATATPRTQAIDWHKHAANDIHLEHLTNGSWPTIDRIAAIIADHVPCVKTSTSATPRTDAAIQRRNFGSGDIDWVSVKHARTLERELSSAQAALAEAKAEVERLSRSASYVSSQIIEPALIREDQLRARVAELDKQIVDEAVLFNDLRSRITELEQDLREDRHLAKLSDENAVLMKRVAELEESVTTLSGQCTSLFNEREALVVDRENMEWLEMQTVEVRAPLNHGSRELFCVSPIRGDGEERPSRLRAAIDTARKGQP